MIFVLRQESTRCSPYWPKTQYVGQAALGRKTGYQGSKCSYQDLHHTWLNRILLKIFFIKYISVLFFPLIALSKTPYLPIHPNFMFLKTQESKKIPNTQSTHRIGLVLGNYSRAWALPWSAVDIPSVKLHWREPVFPLSSITIASSPHP